MLFSRSPDRAIAYRFGCVLNVGDCPIAIANFDRAIQIQSNEHQAWYFRGWALIQLQRNDEAIACFDKVIQIKPDYKLDWLSPEW